MTHRLNACDHVDIHWASAVVHCHAHIRAPLFSIVLWLTGLYNVLKLGPLIFKRFCLRPCSCRKLHRYTFCPTSGTWNSHHQGHTDACHFVNKKHLKNVGPIRHCEPSHALILHCHSPGVDTVASHAACASMSTTTTTTTTTTRDRGDRYGPMEWAQLVAQLSPTDSTTQVVSLLLFYLVKFS